MKLKLTQNIIRSVLISLILFIIIYLYYPYIQNYSNTPKWVILSAIGIISFFFIKPVYSNKLLFFWSLFVLQYFIQCFYSYNFWDAFAYGIPLIISPILVLLVINNKITFSKFSRNLAFIVSIIIVPLLIYSLYELLHLYLTNNFSHAATYHFRYTFGHRNQFSQFITLLIPLISVGLFYEKNKIKKLFYALIILLIYSIALSLMSRVIFIVLIFIYPLCLSIFWITKIKTSLKPYFKYGLRILLLLAIILFISIPLSDIPLLSQLSETSYGSGNERIRLWSNSIELFKENPFLGKGSGNWKIEILKTPLNFTQAENSMVFYRRAHNDFLQILVENGMSGLFLYLIFFIISSVQLFRTSIKPIVKTLLFSGILAFLIISSFSFPLEKIELLFLLFLFYSPIFYFKHKKSNLLKTITFFGLLISFIFSTSWFFSEKKYVESLKNNDVKSLKKISKYFYTIDPTSLPIEWYIANNYFEKGDYNNAINSYLKSLSHNPNHVHAINNLGSSYYKKNMISLAEIEYKKALTINPYFVETLMNYSSLCFNNGRVDEAMGLILSVKKELEPENYKMYITAIGSSKMKHLVQKKQSPNFKQYLINNENNPDFLYKIATDCKKSSLSFENQVIKNYTQETSNF